MPQGPLNPFFAASNKRPYRFGLRHETARFFSCYELKWYDRGEDFLAPPEYRALHPAGTAPIITDGDLVMAESTAIVEYISQRYGDGKLSVPVDDPNYPHYLYWMQFNNNLQTTLFIIMAVQSTGVEPAAGDLMMTTTQRREEGIYRALEQRARNRRQPAQYKSLRGAGNGKVGLPESHGNCRARGQSLRAS